MALLKSMSKMKSFILFILLCMSSYAFSITSAGTTILNQAELTYFNTELGEDERILSNYSYVTVASVYNYTLTPIDDGTSEPEITRYTPIAGTASIPVTIENTGNIKDKYLLSVDNLVGDSGDIFTNGSEISIYLDENGDGLYNPGEKELEKNSDGLYITLQLKPGEFAQLTYVVKVPSFAAQDNNYRFRFNSQSQGDPELRKKNESEVIVVDGPALNLTIGSDPVCQNKVSTGDDIEYRVTYSSVGTRAPEPANEPYEFSIQNESGELIKVSHKGVLITVEKPSNVTIQPDRLLESGQPARDYSPIILLSTPSLFDGGIALVGLNTGEVTNGDNRLLEWVDYSAWDGTGVVEKMGLFVTPSYMSPGNTGHLTYYSQVNDINNSPEFKIYSQATVNLLADDPLIVESNVQCNTLSGISLQRGDNSLIDFETIDTSVLDLSSQSIDHSNQAHFIPTSFYFHESTPGFDNQLDAIHAVVKLPMANLSASTIDIIGPSDSRFPVQLRSSFGDELYWVFAETGPDTGIFRSVLPIHATSPQDPNNPRVRNETHCHEDLAGTWKTGAVNQNQLKADIADIINFRASGLNGTSFENCNIESNPNDILTVEVFDSENNNSLLLKDVASISPQFTIFNSTHFKNDKTGQNIPGIPGAVVKFYQTVNGQVPDVLGDPVVTATSDENGKVFYPKLPISDEGYFIIVEPPEGYVWPTKFIDPVVFNTYRVTASSYGANGNTGEVNSGVFFINSFNGLEIFDIPLDPSNLDRRLTLEKTADKDTAEIGEFVKYTLTLKNNLPESTVYNTRIVDELPYGFKYMAGSARLNDEPLKDPVRTGTYSIEFHLGDVDGSMIAPYNGTYVVTYILQLTAGAVDSDGINSAQAIAHSLASSVVNTLDEGQKLFSNVATYQLGITQTGVMSERGIIFGKVYVDAQCNDIIKNSVWPIGGVKIYLETGDYVITDENGQYSMFGVVPGNHVLKVDKQTLPEGIELLPLDTRNAGAGDSRFVDLRRGEFHKADFVAPCPEENVEAVYDELQGRNNNINGDWLFDTADSFKGLTTSTSERKSSQLTSGIVSGPTTANNATTTTIKQSSINQPFIGYALEYRSGTESSMQEFYNLLPSGIQDEAYVYSSGGKYSLRFGFSNTDDQLEALKKNLQNNNITTTPVETSYSKIPYVSRVKMDNQLEDSIPLPKSDAKKVTREEAKKGTWYWPKGDYSYHGRFIVAVSINVKPSLYVNGKKVSNSQLGEQIKNVQQKAQMLGWYGVQLEPGDNLVEVKALDDFGNERTLLSKVFSHPDSAERINLVNDGQVLHADGGRSVTPIRLQLFDENNNLARGTYFVTLNTSTGNSWLDPDIHDDETGHQVRVHNGEKTVYLRSSDTTGPIKVTASLDDIADTIKVYQVAAKRPLFVSGLLEYTGRYGRISGEEPSRQAEGYEDESYSDDERAALFMKGNVKGGMHLTLSYDSDKSDEDYLREIAPDSYYPLPGDASIRGYDARSTSKWFAKLEKERHFMMWGDYSTSDGADVADLAITSQVLNGFNGMYNDGKFIAQVYAARPEDLHKVIEIDGNGTAMFYTIGDGRIIRHSDTITLVTYSRDNTGLVLGQERLIRYIDYTLDYFTGQITFNRVIPTLDDQLNPIKVRIAYDLEGDGEAYTIAGGRLSYMFTPSLTAGLTYEQNSHDLEGYKLGSLWANYNIDSQTQVTASVATMTHEGSESANTITTTSVAGNKLERGSAAKLSLKRDWSDSSQTELEYAYAQEGFTNISGGIAPARQEVRLRHRQKLMGLTNLNIDASHSESLTSSEKQQSAGATIDTKLFGSAWTTKLGSRYIKNENNSGETEQFTTAIVGLGRSFNLFNRAGRFDTEYERSFDSNAQQRFNVKADWNVHKQANVYANYEYIDSLGGISNLGSGTTSLFTAGIDVDWQHGGSTFSEFRQRGASDGRILEVANGYRGKFEVIPGVSLDPAAEYIEVIEGEGTSGVAVSLGVADVRHPNYKTTGRIEYRHGDTEDYYGLLGAWVTRLSQDWSGLVREELRYLNKDTEENTWSHHLSIGVSYRPRLTNAYNMLGVYEWKVDRNDVRRTAHILSTHHNYQPAPEWLLSGRLGLKWEDYTEYDYNYDSVSTIIDGRVIYYLNRRWDLDLHGGVLGTDGLSSRRYSYGLGLNYLVMKNLRAGIGYNVIGFDDSDLDPQGYNLQGFYFNMMFKLDEGLFGWLSE